MSSNAIVGNSNLLQTYIGQSPYLFDREYVVYNDPMTGSTKVYEKDVERGGGDSGCCCSIIPAMIAWAGGFMLVVAPVMAAYVYLIKPFIQSLAGV